MIEIKKNIYWVGIKDWDLRVFHGHELSTHRGSSYNSYLIKDEKTVLVDTVWDPYKEDFVGRLEREVGLENIDMIVVNHSEMDHAGSLDYLMSKIPNTPIYCTKNGADILKRHFNKEWNFNIVKTGDTLNIGKYELVFVDMQMLHWPDSMLTYVKGAALALSNDAFGQHYAARSLFNDEVDNCELHQEAIKYYANILSPFSPLVKKKIEQIRGMKLDIDMIAPSHGVIWRKDPMQIIDLYYKWSQNYSEDWVAIVYDTMYEGTRMMAEAMGEGLAKKGWNYKLYNAAATDRNDLITDLFKAGGILAGTATVNNAPMPAISGLLDDIKALKIKNKPAAAFGCYGWSGEGAKILTQKLADGGSKVSLEPIQFRYRASADELAQCVEFGEKFADSLK